MVGRGSTSCPWDCFGHQCRHMRGVACLSSSAAFLPLAGIRAVEARGNERHEEGEDKRQSRGLGRRHGKYIS